MSDKEPKLSVEKRILLHLLKYSKAYEDAWEVPHAMSQEGLAEALDILLNNVSRAMKGLRDAGNVEERLAHIKGVKRRRRAYFLTQQGLELAEGIRKEVLSQSVPFIGKDGTAIEETVERVTVVFKLDHGATVSASDVLETVRRSGVFDSVKVDSQLKARSEGEEGAVASRSFVDLTEGAPRLMEFVGREGALARIGQCLDGQGPPVIAVHGMAGIGKTALALRVIEDSRGRRHLFYYRIHSWDSRQNVAAALQELLERIGSRTKQVADMRSLDMNELAMVLVRELGPRPVLLVFDDLHKARVDILPLFRLMMDLSSQFKGLRLMLLSRKAPGLYSRKDVAVSKVVEEVHLDALDRDETRAFLGEDYGEEALERIHGLSRGVPLFLEILSSVENVDAIRDIHMYVEEEIYSELEPGERKVLEHLSVHRFPVPSEAILVDGTVFDHLSGLCRKSLVVELPHRRFEAHDLIREFVLGRLPPDVKRKCHSWAAEYYLTAAERRDPVDELYFSPELAGLEAVHHRLGTGEVQGAADLLLKVGPDLVTLGHTELKEMLGTFDETHVDETTWADLLLLRGDVAVREEEWTTALQDYERALVAKKRLGADRSTLAAIHGMIGRVHMNVERWEETVRSHKDALRMFEEDGDDRGIAKELINLGIVYKNKRDWRNAEASYDKARRLLEGLGDVSGLIVLYNNMALLKWAMGDPRKALALVEKGVEVSKESSDDTGLAMVLFTRGELMKGMGRIDDARRDQEEAASIFRLGKEYDPAIRVFLGIGDMMLDAGRPPDAMRAYLKALDLYQFKKGRRTSIFGRSRMAEDHSVLGRIYDRLASATRAKGEMEEAIRYDLKALDCHEAEGDGRAMARKLLDVGLAKEDLGRFKEAWSYMERALQILTRVGDERGQAAIGLNLVRVCEALSDLKKAKMHAEMVMAMARGLGDPELRSIAASELERLSKGKGRRGRKGKGK